MVGRLVIICGAVLLSYFSIQAQNSIQRVDTGFDVSQGQRLSGVTVADVNGDGTLEICALIKDTSGSERFPERQLVVYDMKQKREFGRVGVGEEAGRKGLAGIQKLFSADIDGDGDDEIVGVRTVTRPEHDHITFSIFDWTNGGLSRRDFYEFRGIEGQAGDLDGDGKDELVLLSLPVGFTHPGGGPVHLLVLKSDDGSFQLMDDIFLSEFSSETKLVDLDQDKDKEIVTIISGERLKSGQSKSVDSKVSSTSYDPARLVVYDYVDGKLIRIINQDLAATHRFTRLWHEEIEGKEHLIIPFFGEDGMGEFDKMVFVKEGNALIQKNVTIPFESHFRNLGWRSTPKWLVKFDEDGDGETEVLEVEDHKRVKFWKRAKN